MMHDSTKGAVMRYCDANIPCTAQGAAQPYNTRVLSRHGDTHAIHGTVVQMPSSGLFPFSFLSALIFCFLFYPQEARAGLRVQTTLEDVARLDDA